MFNERKYRRNNMQKAYSRKVKKAIRFKIKRKKR
ncbi:MAG: hypothetical protein KatS3mg003_2215 [Candidatus Nitrosocaldaceae archaeon]|nr:MAG: hypothetical protein KatS3mg003_2183 [Candidatus Nitrosocaldaceae archaeon]GIU72736.1 MAG: hypothetical protein KatS3mg003_2215 [Candidatus Nitrosocaldaceae archaeon]